MPTARSAFCFEKRVSRVGRRCQYRKPLKGGIPAVAVLSRQGQVVYATRAGELADARKMGDKGIFEFFSKVAAHAK